jgi:DNA repair exonuclease SbcCD ATPase subunit
MENLRHEAEELESCKKLARNLEEKLETDILHHQKEIMEYEKNKRLTSILIETTERHIQNFKEHKAQRRQQLSELEGKHARAPDVPQTARGGKDFPHNPSTLSQALSTSSRKHVFYREIFLVNQVLHSQ